MQTCDNRRTHRLTNRQTERLLPHSGFGSVDSCPVSSFVCSFGSVPSRGSRFAPARTGTYYIWAPYLKPSLVAVGELYKLYRSVWKQGKSISQCWIHAFLGTKFNVVTCTGRYIVGMNLSNRLLNVRVPSIRGSPCLLVNDSDTKSMGE